MPKTDKNPSPERGRWTHHPQLAEEPLALTVTRRKVSRFLKNMRPDRLTNHTAGLDSNPRPVERHKLETRKDLKEE